MVEMLLLGLFTVFFIVGISEFVFLIRLIFYHPNAKTECYAVVVLKKDFALKQLNYIWQKMRWHGDNFAVGIIAITDNLDYNEISDCDTFIKDKNIFLSNSNSIAKCTIFKKQE